MRTSRYGRLAVVPMLLLTSAACGQQAGATGAGDSGAPEKSYSADTVVFRMDHTGGFTTPAMLATRLPAISVYGDGRVITQGPVTMAYPGPALPNLQVGKISVGELENLIKTAREAGVGSVTDLGSPPVADVTSTRFTVFDGTKSEQLEVYALEVGTGDLGPGADQGVTAEQQAAREKLRAFAESLTGESGPLGTAHLDTQAYVPTAVAAVAEAYVANDETLKQAEVAWPGPALPGAELNKDLGLSCVTFTGEQAQQVLAAAGDANAATPWASEGKRWTVTLRPLLPDESDCGDLASRR
ncbi:hypothetical protein E0H26_08760 [Micromonospora zingiberis]|uniref:Lipoprotein n=1 Tax=Micromonospora zingiberis TaxID=2053011 RepID=A0A4R0GRM7_9ACTN|nr:hypothetical protein [Micromonospora zingiberis]TCB98459.1 hypothetical protein E0H26_08760 [Micromonospora zingiberis]